MMREQFLAKARSYIGTPFHHQGRLPGVGLDCAGVIVCALQACGYPVQDVQGYGRIPSGSALQQAVLKHCTPIAQTDVQSGDIMLFAFRDDPQHLAVFDGGMLIHAYADVGRVVENNMDATWQARLRGRYRLKGLE